MDIARIVALLRPYMAGATPSPALLEQLQLYLDLLLRWNARMNLTSVRDPEGIVARHFGESLFAAQLLLGAGERNGPSPQGIKLASDPVPHVTADAMPVQNTLRSASLADVGSGAGFPGVPMKLFAPQIELTLIESHNKKATFLREVIRTLGLQNADVFSGRAEQWGKTADLVTLRAVEQFERALPAAAQLVTAGGKLCLLLGAGQIPTAQEMLGPRWAWHKPHVVPQSTGRLVLVGSR